MNQSEILCPVNPEAAMAVADHQAAPDLVRQLESHAEHCTACRKQVEEAQSLRIFSRAALALVEPPVWLFERSLEQARQSHRKVVDLRRRLVLCLAFGALAIGLLAATMMLKKPETVSFEAVMRAYALAVASGVDYKTADSVRAEAWLKEQGLSNTSNHVMMLKKGVRLKGVAIVDDSEGRFAVWQAEWNGSRVAGIQPPKMAKYPANVGQVMLGQEFGFAAPVGRKMVLIKPCKDSDFFLVIEEPDRLRRELENSYFNCK